MTSEWLRDKRRWVVGLLLLSGAVLLWWQREQLGLWFVWLQQVVQQAASVIRGFGIWGPLASIGLMVLATLFAPIPGSPIAVANGVVFGPIWGSLLSWVGGLLGASVAFGAARWFGSGLVTRLFGAAALQSIDRLSERHGFWALLVIRLVPGLSFDLISFVAGLTTLRYRWFLLATAIGMAPNTILWTVLGNDLANIDQYQWRVGVIIVILVAGYIFGMWLYRRTRS